MRGRGPRRAPGSSPHRVPGFGVATARGWFAGHWPRDREPGIEQPSGVELLLDRVKEGCVRLTGGGIPVLIGGMREGSHAGSTPRGGPGTEHGTARASLPESGPYPAPDQRRRGSLRPGMSGWWAERTSMRTAKYWSKVTRCRYVRAGHRPVRRRNDPRPLLLLADQRTGRPVPVVARQLGHRLRSGASSSEVTRWRSSAVLGTCRTMSISGCSTGRNWNISRPSCPILG